MNAFNWSGNYNQRHFIDNKQTEEPPEKKKMNPKSAGKK